MIKNAKRKTKDNFSCKWNQVQKIARKFEEKH